GGEMTQNMRQKLKRAGYRSRYRLRKQIVEPVFGQIKQARGFRQFLLRGLEAVQAEWALICTAHNITKLATAICRPLSQLLTPSRRYLDGLLGLHPPHRRRATDRPCGQRFSDTPHPDARCCMAWAGVCANRLRSWARND